jgi:hypothetical protein
MACRVLEEAVEDAVVQRPKDRHVELHVVRVEDAAPLPLVDALAQDSPDLRDVLRAHGLERVLHVGELQVLVQILDLAIGHDVRDAHKEQYRFEQHLRIELAD